MGKYKSDYPDLKSCLEDIFRNEGIECLENSGKLISMLTDLIPQNPGAINMVKRMREHGLLMEFRKAHTQDEAAKTRVIHSAIDKLVNWESIDAQKAEGYVRIFAQVMQWQLVVKSTAPDTSLQNRLHENAGLQEEKYSLQTPVAAPSPKPMEPAWKRNVLREPVPGLVHAERRYNPGAFHMFGNLFLPDREAVFSVTFLDTKPGAEQRTQDVSQEKDGSVVAWAVERPKQDWRCYGWGNMPQPTYDLFIAADGGINGKVACSRLFCSCSNLNHIHFNGHFHTIDATDMSYMFFKTRPKSLDLSSIQTTNVTNMSWMFSSCIMDASLDLSGFDTSHVTNMSSMFSNFSSSSLILTGFNTANVENMECMFSGCRVSKLDLSSFQTHNVKDVTAMFHDCDAQLTLVNPDFRKVEKYMEFPDFRHALRGLKEDSRTVNSRPLGGTVR